MAYRGVEGSAIAPVHRLEDFAGAVVTGQAGAFVTTLREPDGSTSAVVVTVAEIGTSGLYTFTFTPDATGVWLLDLEEPGGGVSTGQTRRIDVDVITAVAAAALGAFDLTTLARVKGQLFNGSIVAHQLDTLIGERITGGSEAIRSLCGRAFHEQTFTEAHNGRGIIRLRQGPVVSITSVEVLERDGGTVTVDDTLIEDDDFTSGNTRDEGAVGLGRLYGYFPPGRRNIRVVYTAGWSVIPGDVVDAATDHVVGDILTRELKGLASSSLGVGSVTAKPDARLLDSLARRLGRYRGHLLLPS